MKIVYYDLRVYGVEKGKEVIIREKSDNMTPLIHNNKHELSLNKGTNLLCESDYSLTPRQNGCNIDSDIGDTIREYHFMLDDEFVKEFEDFLKQYIEKQVKKIDNDFK